MSTPDFGIVASGPVSVTDGAADRSGHDATSTKPVSLEMDNEDDDGVGAASADVAADTEGAAEATTARDGTGSVAQAPLMKTTETAIAQSRARDVFRDEQTMSSSSMWTFHP